MSWYDKYLTPSQDAPPPLPPTAAPAIPAGSSTASAAKSNWWEKYLAPGTDAGAISDDEPYTPPLWQMHETAPAVAGARAVSDSPISTVRAHAPTIAAVGDDIRRAGGLPTDAPMPAVDEAPDSALGALGRSLADVWQGGLSQVADAAQGRLAGVGATMREAAEAAAERGPLGQILTAGIAPAVGMLGGELERLTGAPRPPDAGDEAAARLRAHPASAFASDVLSTAPQIAEMMAAGPAALPMIAAQAGGGALRKAEAQGATEGQARAAALGTGATEAALSALPLHNLNRMLGAGKRTIMQQLGDVARQAGLEMSEEGLASAANRLVELAAYKREQGEEWTAADRDAAIRDALIGAVTGAVTGAAASAPAARADLAARRQAGPAAEPTVIETRTAESTTPEGGTVRESETTTQRPGAAPVVERVVEQRPAGTPVTGEALQAALAETAAPPLAPVDSQAAKPSRLYENERVVDEGSDVYDERLRMAGAGPPGLSLVESAPDVIDGVPVGPQKRMVFRAANGDPIATALISSDDNGKTWRTEHLYSRRHGRTSEDLRAMVAVGRFIEDHAAFVSSGPITAEAANARDILMRLRRRQQAPTPQEIPSEPAPQAPQEAVQAQAATPAAERVLDESEAGDLVYVERSKTERAQQLWRDLGLADKANEELASLARQGIAQSKQGSHADRRYGEDLAGAAMGEMRRRVREQDAQAPTPERVLGQPVGVTLPVEAPANADQLAGRTGRSEPGPAQPATGGDATGVRPAVGQAVAGRPSAIATGVGASVPLPGVVYRGEADTPGVAPLTAQRPSHLWGPHYTESAEYAGIHATKYGERGQVSKHDALPIEKPFSVERDYSYDELRTVDERAAVEAARAAGITESSQPVPGGEMQRALRFAYVAEATRQGRVMDDVLFEESVEHAGRKLQAAGYDGYHHEVDVPGRGKANSWTVFPKSPSTATPQSPPLFPRVESRQPGAGETVVTPSASLLPEAATAEPATAQAVAQQAPTPEAPASSAPVAPIAQAPPTQAGAVAAAPVAPAEAATTDAGGEAFSSVAPQEASLGSLGGNVLRPVTEFFGNQRKALPTPSATVATSADPAAEKRWQAAKGITRAPLFQRLRERLAELSELRHTYPGINPRKGGMWARANDILRRADAARNAAARRAVDDVDDITKALSPAEGDLFTRLTALPDLLASIERGLYADKAVPFYEPEVLAADTRTQRPLAEVQQIIAADLARFESESQRPEFAAVRDALAKRQAIVKDVVDQLVKRKLLPEEVLADPRYYHRQVLAYMEAEPLDRQLGRAGKSLTPGKAGFQRERTGGGDFNTDYQQAEVEWLSDAYERIARADAKEELRKEVDISAKLRAQAREIGERKSKAATGDTKGWRDHQPDWRTLVPDTHVLWSPEKGNKFYSALTVTERALNKLLDGEKGLDVRSVLALGSREQWAIPRGVAHALETTQSHPNEGTISRALSTAMTSLKQWALLSPFRAIKYSLNNISGDADIALAIAPKIFTYAQQSARDLFNYHARRKASPQLRAELNKLQSGGVLDTGLTVEEIPDISQEGLLRPLYTRNQSVIPKLVNRYWQGVKGFNNWRENTLRLAAYRYFRDTWAAGKRNYGASDPAQIDALANADHRAMKLAREAIGDYGNVSEGGKWLRRNLMPFYSWLEVNAPRYVQLFRNSASEGRRAGATGRAAVGLGVRATAATLANAHWLYLASYLWNKLMFPEEEKELRQAGNREHVVLMGRNDSGEILSVRFEGALADSLEWFGLADWPQEIRDVAGGKKSVAAVAAEAVKAPVERLAQGLRFEKSIPEAMLGGSVFPRVFEEGTGFGLNLRPITDPWGHVAQTLAGGPVWEAATDKPARGGAGIAGRMAQALSPVYRTDPGESAYWQVRKWVRDFDEEGAASGGGRKMTPRQLALYYWKKSLRYGDEARAQRYLDKYYRLGGTERGIQQSIERSGPTGGLPRGDRARFREQLSADELEVLERAERWYGETFENGGTVPVGGRQRSEPAFVY